MLTPADSHPAHFTRGSLIQLASGQMKKVEELDTDDFLSSAAHSPEVNVPQIYPECIFAEWTKNLADA